MSSHHQRCKVIVNPPRAVNPLNTLPKPSSNVTASFWGTPWHSAQISSVHVRPCAPQRLGPHFTTSSTASPAGAVSAVAAADAAPGRGDSTPQGACAVSGRGQRKREPGWYQYPDSHPSCSLGFLTGERRLGRQCPKRPGAGRPPALKPHEGLRGAPCGRQSGRGRLAALRVPNAARRRGPSSHLPGSAAASAPPKSAPDRTFPGGDRHPRPARGPP